MGSGDVTNVGVLPPGITKKKIIIITIIIKNIYIKINKKYVHFMVDSHVLTLKVKGILRRA